MLVVALCSLCLHVLANFVAPGVSSRYLNDAQDLAQDLPQDAVALELVLDRVREHDSTVSNEQARTILVSRPVIPCPVMPCPVCCAAQQAVGVDVAGGAAYITMVFSLFGVFFCHSE